MTTNKQAALEYEAVRRASEPAYPCSLGSDAGHQDGPNTWQYPGLTKRELFAMTVIGGFAADPGTTHLDIETIAASAVRWADALIAELERTK